MNIYELFQETARLNKEIIGLLIRSRFNNYEDLSGVDYQKEAEQLLLVDELRGILGKLQDVSCTISYMERPIKAEGVLRKAENGRYKLHSENTQYDEYEFSSGTGIEYLTEDNRYEIYDEEKEDYINIPYWSAGTVEHNGTDYYITGAPKDLVLENLKVRIR